jgi:segregation and condensation protein B
MEALLPVVECLLFAAGEPLALRDLMRTTEATEQDITRALQALQEKYESAGSGLQIVEIAGGWQMATRPEFAPLVGKMLAPSANRLSRPALETVTIIAYRQPCTQAEIEAIRGVSVDGVLKTLLERELIHEAGRRPSPGRPILYGTTDAFLHYFGLASLADLPPLEEEEVTEDQQTMVNLVLEAASIV